ncbi:hypothetical protein ACQ856_29545 (plasmid) [Mycolicibacterium psychrotolerans]|uniref:hypothetical protein n=1 Tax=Mycolicibacterium psychrotolerans TaxID=216929 RepID=UPI003D6671F4
MESLAAHHEYLTVLDPHTPVTEQARKVLEMTAPTRGDGCRTVGFVLVRSR